MRMATEVRLVSAWREGLNQLSLLEARHRDAFDAKREELLTMVLGNVPKKTEDSRSLNRTNSTSRTTDTRKCLNGHSDIFGGNNISSYDGSDSQNSDGLLNESPQHHTSLITENAASMQNYTFSSPKRTHDEVDKKDESGNHQEIMPRKRTRSPTVNDGMEEESQYDNVESNNEEVELTQMDIGDVDVDEKYENEDDNKAEELSPIIEARVVETDCDLGLKNETKCKDKSEQVSNGNDDEHEKDSSNVPERLSIELSETPTKSSIGHDAIVNSEKKSNLIDDNDNRIKGMKEYAVQSFTVDGIILPDVGDDRAHNSHDSSMGSGSELPPPPMPQIFQCGESIESGVKKSITTENSEFPAKEKQHEENSDFDTDGAISDDASNKVNEDKKKIEEAEKMNGKDAMFEEHDALGEEEEEEEEEEEADSEATQMVYVPSSYKKRQSGLSSTKGQECIELLDSDDDDESQGENNINDDRHSASEYAVLLESGNMSKLQTHMPSSQGSNRDTPDSDRPFSQPENITSNEKSWEQSSNEQRHEKKTLSSLSPSQQSINSQ